MPKTFKIRNIPGLKGLLVVGDMDDVGFVGVKMFVNDNIVIGDRPLKYPVPDGAVFISGEFLDEQDEDGSREYAYDNPYGQHIYEGRFQKDNLEIVHAVYEKALTVSIIEKNPPNMKGVDRTIFSGNFTKNKRGKALEIIEEMLHGKLDPDDLVFELSELQGG